MMQTIGLIIFKIDTNADAYHAYSSSRFAGLRIILDGITHSSAVRRERGRVSQPLTPRVKSVMPHTSTSTCVDSVSDNCDTQQPPDPASLGIRWHLHQRCDQAQQCLLFRPIPAAQELAQLNVGQSTSSRGVGLVNDESMTAGRLAPEEPCIAVRAAI